MNFAVFQYRYARNALAQARDVVTRLDDRPVCCFSSLGEMELLENSAKRAEEIPKFIDRLRFLAKHDRSRYFPHIGAKQQSKHDNRSVCCLSGAA